MVEFTSKLYNQMKKDKAADFAKSNADLIQMAVVGHRLKDELLTRLGENLAQVLIDCGIGKTCLNCDHWNTDGSYGTPTAYNNKLPEGCTLFKRLPPPKIIVKGCDKHTDQIPF